MFAFLQDLFTLTLSRLAASFRTVLYGNCHNKKSTIIYFFLPSSFLKLKLEYNGLKCDKRDHIKLGADALSPICETDLWGSKMANYPSF